jgi:hypothetical protein
MKESGKSSRKHIIELKKQSVSEKTRSENPTPPGGKDDPFSPFPTRPVNSLGRKYVQDNLFKNREKEGLFREREGLLREGPLKEKEHH